MKQYYYTDGLEKYGPFSLEGLKAESIKPDTLVWFAEQNAWKPAKDILDLRPLLGLAAEEPSQQFISPLSARVSTDPDRNGDALIVLGLSIWVLGTLINVFATIFMDWWYDSPLKYISMLSSFGYVLLPILMALAIRKPQARKVGLILAICIALMVFYTNVNWVFSSLINEFGLSI